MVKVETTKREETTYGRQNKSQNEESPHCGVESGKIQANHVVIPGSGLV
jgi:hypothetical protein